VKFHVLYLVLLLILSSRVASAGEMRAIELTDGSIITGEITSLHNGIFTIKSGSLGTIKIEESKIRTIKMTSAPDTIEITTLQRKMLSDTEIMTLIQSLQNDPDFKKILEDPQIMKAVREGDIATLQTNTTFMKLMTNATVQDIEKKIK